MGETITVSAGESIQEALDEAAEGSTVIVEPGIYEEQVRVRTDGITLRGKKGATIRPAVPEATNDCSWFGLGAAICVAKDFVDGANERFPGQPAPTEKIGDVSIIGFAIEGPIGFGIWSTMSTDLVISRNTVTGTTGPGISIGVVDRFDVNRNAIDNEGGANFTPLLFVGDSSNGRLTRNIMSGSATNGAVLDELRNVTFSRNTVEEGCGGVLVSSRFGSESEMRKVKIERNLIRDNNKTCEDPSVSGAIGGYGILAINGSRLTIRFNEVIDNVVAEPTVTPGGLIVGPAPGGIGPKNVVVARNTVRGNSVGGVTTDLLLDARGKLTVSNNDCGVSLPDSSWCSP